MSKVRVDQIVLKLFPQYSRSQVQSLIAKGGLKVKMPNGQWKVVDRPGLKLEISHGERENFEIQDQPEFAYVSRGALKLKAAVESFSIPVSEKLVLDVGQSTGGFTDYCLKEGAQKILGVDVGSGQLHPSLRQSPQVLSHENINARHPIADSILEEFFGDRSRGFDLIVVDVSFISLSLVIPSLLGHLSKNGFIVCLVKPQFELERQDLNKKGVVKEESKREQALAKIIGVFEENKLKIVGHIPSPIEGDHGNKEYLLVGTHP